MFFFVKNPTAFAATIFLTVSMFSCKEKVLPPDNNQPPDNSQPTAQLSVVSTIAGKYVSDEMFLTSTSGMVVAADGSIFLSDIVKNCIRKISVDGKVSLFAGSLTGAEGIRNGKGSAALFSRPEGMALDLQGNILVADGNCMIRKIDMDGNVSSFAGNGKVAVIDGPAASASFSSPYSIAVNSKGEVYVSDFSSEIRKIDLNGNVTTFAGSLQGGYRDGRGTAALFQGSLSLAFDKWDVLYVAERTNQRIRKVDGSGLVSTVAGSGNIGSGNGMGKAASFNFPSGITFDSAGDLLVADSWNHLIRKVSPSGLVSNYVGSGVKGNVNGKAALAAFSHPAVLCYDAKKGLYVAEPEAHRVRKVLPSTDVVPLYGDVSPVDGAALEVYFSRPEGIVLDRQGNIYVSDMDNNMIRRISGTGYVNVFAGNTEAGFLDAVGANARFSAPMGLAINDNGEIFVADRNNALIRKISPSGVVDKVPGDYAITVIKPSVVVLDKSGNIYCNDVSYSSLYKIDKNGRPKSLAQSWGTSGNGWMWDQPSGMIVDGQGNIYVADSGNNTICKSVNDGDYFSLLAGRRGYANYPLSGNTNGTLELATFNRPRGIAMDGAGNIYVADSNNHLIRKISASGMVTTIAGSGVAGYSDGVALAAKFNHPGALALNSDGTVLYVADEDNYLIRKIVLGK
ncbi:hypothetical protein [Pedobacter sp. UBA5917]|uniref:hypothetical protein n=1 Tax=Pedobacter sp. UBA5917 TaxID=1947061 RepID=UPI0025EDD641|nr:hypothetical protein [Pedobacter sp. UBA5917]